MWNNYLHLSQSIFPKCENVYKFNSIIDPPSVQKSNFSLNDNRLQIAANCSC